MSAELADLTTSDPKGVYFPFAENEVDLDANIKRKKFNKCGDDAIALLHSLKPYPLGNAALRGLHDLDIQDKHKALIVAASAHDIEITGSYNLDDMASGTFIPVLQGFEFKLPDDSAFGGQPALETLEHLVEITIGVLEAFAGIVAARA